MRVQGSCCGIPFRIRKSLSYIYGASDIRIGIAWSAGVFGREIQTFLHLDVEIYLGRLVN